MKLNKTIKLLIIILAAFASILVAFKLVNGTFLSPFEDIKAINNPDKYLEVDTLTVSLIRYDIRESNKTASENSKFCIYFQTKMGEKKIYYYQNRYKINLFKMGGKNKMIVLKNKINNNIFLKDDDYIKTELRSSYLSLLLYTILSLTIIFILINKKYVTK